MDKQWTSNAQAVQMTMMQIAVQVIVQTIVQVIVQEVISCMQGGKYRSNP